MFLCGSAYTGKLTNTFLDSGKLLPVLSGEQVRFMRIPLRRYRTKHVH